MLAPTDLLFSIHLLGALTGIALYLMLGVMAWRQYVAAKWIAEPLPETRRGISLLLAASLGVLLSVTANVLHLRTQATPSSFLSGLLVIGYALLTGLLIIHLWHSTAVQRVLSIIAIGVFAWSAWHLIWHRAHVDSLAVELAVHYAPLPLVAALLYEEYRFVFADVFLKRALALILLVALAAALHAVGQASGSPVMMLALWIVTALAYPGLRYAVNTVVDRYLLRRVPVREVRARAAAGLVAAETTEAVLDHICRILQTALTVRSVHWHTQQAARDESLPLPAARVDVPVTDAPRYTIDIGTLAGGRRFLSEDWELADALALDAARRIDSLRITTERYERSTREEEMRRLAAEAELRALQVQLNPHFLFNALTTIGYLIQTSSNRALSTLLRLTELLRALLRQSSGTLVTLHEEIALVQAYLAIEQERFEERLVAQLDIPVELHTWKIPPLVIQPLVENAIKHGITPSRTGGQVTVSVNTIVVDGGGRALQVRVHDTGAGMAHDTIKPSVNLQEHNGVGLQNIERRLQHYYGPAAMMRMTQKPGHGTLVELVIPAEPSQ